MMGPSRFDESVFDDGLHAVRADGPVLLVTRSSKEFEDVGALQNGADGLRTALAGRPRSSTALVIDLRQARGRTDPAFEEVWAPLRRELFSSWAAVAVICQTQVGRMHVQRHMRQDGLDWHVVVDEAEAFAHARDAVQSTMR
ncbi:MAG: hypothetical protein AB8I08_03415 [Sandaracinaceae bacterium]